MHVALLLLAAASAEELLARSIAYHDPDARWATGAFELTLGESRPDGTERETRVVLDNGNGAFSMARRTADGRLVEVAVRGDRVSAEVDGSSAIDAEDVERLRLGPEQVRRTRNYYLYLYGLPMKIRDPGARLHPETRRTHFDGRPADELKVTYDESVGTDTWYFYLDVDTGALVGYRFYHDESANDGEYIVLSGETEGAGLRLPRVREWYRHQDEGYLGTDTLIAIRPHRGSAPGSGAPARSRPR